jgi:hypothetical protein
MFGIESRYVRVRTCPSIDGRKAFTFHIQFFICKARALLLARRSLETSPNSMPPNYDELSKEINLYFQNSNFYANLRECVICMCFYFSRIRYLKCITKATLLVTVIPALFAGIHFDFFINLINFFLKYFAYILFWLF